MSAGIQLERGRYWQREVSAGTVPIHGKPHPLIVHIHIQEEEYSGRFDEIVPISAIVGESNKRTGLSAQFLSPTPDDSPTDELLGGAWGRFYPQDSTLFIIEFWLSASHRQINPLGDKALALFWANTERQFIKESPDTRQIITRGWSVGYEHSSWQEFLRRHGYRSFDRQTFVKSLGK